MRLNAVPPAPTATEWHDMGYRLVAFQRGTKAPQTRDWHQTAADPQKVNGHNVGVIHGLSGTCSMDLDDLALATQVLEALGLDVDDRTERAETA